MTRMNHVRHVCMNVCFLSTMLLRVVLLLVCTGGAAAAAVSCIEGYTGTSGTCVFCTAGKYKATTGTEACTDCAAGKASAQSNQATEVWCIACVKGKYAGTAGASACANCAAGKYGPSAGLTTCTDCAAGTAIGVAGYQQSCTDCEPGLYAAVAGMSACAACPAGKTGIYNSLTSCANCAFGTYVSVTGSIAFNSCIKCAAGKYSGVAGVSSSSGCTACAAGKTSTVTGATAEGVCVAVPCLLGQYVSGVLCVDCNAGTYSDVTGVTSCAACPAGAYSDVARASSASACVGCAAGAYSGVTGTTACVSCPAGSYSLAGASACVSCLAGSYSLAGASVCVSCPAGSYSEVTGTTACVSCLAGSYSLVGATSCITCSAGTYSLAGSSTCTLCAAGFTNSVCTYTDLVRSCGASGNEACGTTMSSVYEGAASFGGLSGLTADGTYAIDGNVGTYTFSREQSVVTWLRLDFGRPVSVSGVVVTNRQDDLWDRLDMFTIAVGNTDLVDANAICASNKPAPIVAPYTASITCPTVLNGRYVFLSIYPGNPAYLSVRRLMVAEMNVMACYDCTVCSAGTYKTTSGSAACTNCGVGKYLDTRGATSETSCLSCSADTISPSGSSAVTACTCNAGYTGPNAGPCSACVPGTYKIGGGSAGCTSCGVGTYSASTGATAAATCQTCPGGSYSLAGSTACVSCPAGSYSLVGTSACITCSAGTYSLAGSTACITCPAGTYSLAGSTACITCPAGSYSLAGSTACITCSPGSYSLAGSTACITCAAGSYSLAGATACTGCPLGTYSGVTGSSSVNTCVQCPAGAYSGVSGASACVPCPAGSNSSTPGATSVTNCVCSAGFYGPNGGACLQCPAPSSSDAGSISVENCTKNLSGRSLLQIAQTCAAGTTYASSCTTTISTLHRSCGTSETDTCSAAQISTWSVYSADQAIDGNLATRSETINQENAWWRLDFGRSVMVTKVIVYNRADCCWERLANFKIAVGDSSSVEVNSICASNIPAPQVSPYMADVPCSTPLRGQYLHISIYGPDRLLSISEVQVTGCPACTPCAAGTYKSATGSEVCTNCSAGAYSSVTGASVCVSCPAGSFSGVSGATACTNCSQGMFAVGGASNCTFYHQDKDLTFWFKYKSAYANNRITNDGTDTVFFIQQRPGWSMSTFARRGMYSAQQCDRATFLFPSYDPITCPLTNMPLDWSNKAITYSNWVYVSSNNLNGKYYVPFSMRMWNNVGSTQGDITFQTDGYFNGNWYPPIITFNDNIVVPNPSNSVTLDVKYNLLTMKDRWTLIVLQVYEYNAAGNVAIDMYYNNTNIFSSQTGVVMKNFPRFSFEFGGRGMFDTSITDQCYNFDDTRYYRRKLSSADIAWLVEPCPSGQLLDEDTSLCGCQAGYVSVSGACVACAAGKYAAAGASACSDCLAGAYSGVTGASSSSACTNCSAGTYSNLTGASSSSACVSCPAGSYSSVSGATSASTCVQCPAGTYSLAGASTCALCPTSSSSAPGSVSITNCVCNAGFYGPNGGNCTACASTFTSLPGSLTAAGCGCAENTYVYFMPVVGTQRACGINSNAECPTTQSKTYQTGNEASKSVDLDSSSYSWATWVYIADGSQSTWWRVDLGTSMIISNFNIYFNGENHYVVQIGDTDALDANPTCAIGNIPNTGQYNIYCQKDCANIITASGSISTGTISTTCSEATTANTGKVSMTGRFVYIRSGNPLGLNMWRWWDIQMYNVDITRLVSTCVMCPSESISPFNTSSKTISHCKCRPAYTGPDGGTCSACVAGKFKNSTGSASCTDCPSGTYSSTVAANTSVVCLNCPPGTYSGVAGASSVSACVNCPVNTYAGTAGASACTACAAGKSSTGTGATAEGVCKALTCAPGAYLSGNLCANCSAGTYSNLTGASSADTCVSCPVGSYSSAAGATSASTCVACPTGKYSNVTGASACITCGVNDCFCKNFGLNDVVIENVQWKCGLNKNQACSIDPVSPGYMWTGSASSMIDGVESTYGTVANTNVNPGYVRIDLGVSRKISSIKSAYFYALQGYGDMAIEVGNVNAISTTTSFPNKFCTWFATYNTQKYCTSECSVLTYSSGGSGPYDACRLTTGTPTTLQGQYVFLRGVNKDNRWSDPGNYYGQLQVYEIYINAMESQCIACPANSESPASNVSKTISSCLCNVGYTGPNGGVCTACVAGKYKNTSGSANCTSCSVSTYSDLIGSSVCTSCRAGTYSTLPGSTRLFDCGCEENTYTDTTIINNIQWKCGVNKNQSCGVMCMQQSSSYGPCSNFVDMDLNSFTEVVKDVNSNCPWWRVDLESSQIIDSFDLSYMTAPNSNGVVRVEIGDIDAPGMNDLCWQFTGIDTNTYPPSNVKCSKSYTQGRYFFIRHVQLPDYQYGCGATPSISIKNVLIRGAPSLCTPCPQISVLPFSTQRKNITECICQPGFFIDIASSTCSRCNTGKFSVDRQCSNCPSNTYSSVSGSLNCSDCPSGFGSLSGSSKCQCAAGYRATSDGNCVLCEAGKFKGVLADINCTSCENLTYAITIVAGSSTVYAPYATSAPPGSVDVTNCSCASGAGYTCKFCLMAIHSRNICSKIVALITYKPAFASMSTLSNFQVLWLPTYVPTGGPSGKGHVSFSSGQHLYGVPRTFNIVTNGGMTSVTMLRFQTYPPQNTRIIEGCDQGGSMACFLFFVSSSNFEITFKIPDTSNTINHLYGSISSFLQPGVWFTITVQLNMIERFFVMTVTNMQTGVTMSQNGVPYSKTTFSTSISYKDMPLSYIYLGKGEGNWIARTDTFNGDIAGAFLVDEYLSTAAVSTVIESMRSGVDFTQPTCLCYPCDPGSYKNITGLKSCTSCEVGQYSNVIGVSDCPGCQGGTYSNVTGLTICHKCMTGTYSNTVGASSVTMCINCTAGTYSSLLGVSTCTTCPSFSTSVEGSSDIVKCICNTSSYGSGGTCTACGGGLMTNSSGSLSAQSCGCPTNTWTGMTITDNAQWKCGVNKNQVCSTSCQSQTSSCSNFINNGVDYLNYAGSVAPIWIDSWQCPWWRVDLETAEYIDYFDFTYDGQIYNMYGSTFVQVRVGDVDSPTVNPICLEFTSSNSGNSGNQILLNLKCTTALRGRYFFLRHMNSNLGCTNDGAHIYMRHVQITRAQYECTTCPVLSTSSFDIQPKKITACVCTTAGYTIDAALKLCVGCVAGKFGVNGMCYDCPVGTFSNVSGATACMSCPPGLNASAGSPVCCKADEMIVNSTCASFWTDTSLNVWYRFDSVLDCQLETPVENCFGKNYGYLGKIVYPYPGSKWNVLGRLGETNAGLLTSDDSKRGTYSFQSIEGSVYFYPQTDYAGKVALQSLFFTNLTLSVWMRRTSCLSSGYIVMDRIFQLYFTQTYVRLYLFDSSYYDNVIIPSNNAWHHLAMTVELQSNNVKMVKWYVNAVLVDTQTRTFAMPAINYLNYLYFAFYHSILCTDRTRFDDFRIYNRSLPDDKIRLLYAPCANDGYFNEDTFTCGCQAGYVSVNSVCVACQAGTYAAGGDSACTNCVVGKYSGASAASASACVSCPTGTYSIMTGASSSAVCTNCTAGAYSSVTGVSACLNCPAGAYSLSSGMTACILCVTGKYKDVTGNGSCADCGANTYSGTVGATGAGVCVNCPSNSSSAVSSTVIGSCVCNAGATGPNGGPCVLCAVGKFKSVNGTAVCTDCLAGSYSGTLGANSSDTCLSCPNNSWVAGVGSSLVTACTCNTGASGPNGGPCALCVPGKYKTVIGSSVCLNCSANTFSSVTGATAISACSNCGDNSQSGGSSAACVCNKGYSGPDGGTCFACVAGTYKTGSGSQACTFCANNTFSGVVGSTNASVCQACQANAISAAGSVGQEYCYCKPGYAHLEGTYTCRDCTPGTYNSRLDQRACSNCTIGMYSLNYTAISPETCKFCPAGQWSPEGSANCNLCPAHSHTLNVSGRVTDCVCDVGYIGPGGSTCVGCAAGLYKDRTGPDGCVTCPALTSSFPATERATDCWCVSGYIKVAGVCVAMIPRPIQVSGSLQNLPANPSPAQIQNASEYLRRSIAAQFNVAIELVQVDRVANSSNVQVLLFARSETEAALLQRKVSLATAAPTQSALPFLLLATGNASVGEARTVLITVNITYAAMSLSRQSEALFALTAEISELFDVPVYDVSYTFDASAGLLTPRVIISVQTPTRAEFVRVAGAAQALLALRNVTLPELRMDLVAVGDAGPSGLNFTHAFIRTNGSAMSGAEAQASLQAVVRQLSWFYNVPADDVSVVITNASACVVLNGTKRCFDGVYTAQVLVASNSGVSTENLLSKYALMSASVQTPQPLVLELPFELDNIFYFTDTGVSDFYVEMELVDSSGVFLSGAQVAQAKDVLTWHLAEFFQIDASRVHFETIAPRLPMLNNASNVRVRFDCDAAQLAGLLDRASQLTATATILVQPATIAGLANAVQAQIFGQMVNGQFVQCPPNFVVDAEACKCKRGYVLAGASCVPCAAGAYSTALDAHECANCSMATFSLGGATACTPCHANSNASVGSTSQDACQCSPGFFFLTLLEIGDGVYNTVQNYYCLPCVNGSFKGDEGNWNCSDCSTAYYSSDALSCNTCNAGYARNDTNSSACVSCPKGSFKPAPDSSACLLCAADSFSNVTAALSCESCPAGYRSLSGTVNSTDCCALNSRPVAAPSIQCSCNSGYTGPDSGTSKGQCSACLPGTHKASNGSAYCTNCSIGTYSASVAADSNTTCAMCAAGLYAPQASAKCTVCPANSAAPERSGLITNCLCNTGYTGPNGGSCVACPAGTYKTTNGSAYCTNCSIGTYSTSVAADSNTTCAKCAAGQSSVEGGTNCTACPVGKYNPQAGGPCMVCSENSNSSTGALICTCNADSLGPNGGRCMLKPPLWYRFEVDSELNNSGLAGSTYDLEKVGTTPALDAGVYREGIASARFTAWSDNVDNLYRNKAFWVKNVPLTFTFWFQWTQASYSTMAALVGVTAYRDATNQGIGFDINDPTQGCYAFYGQAPNMWVPSPKGCGIALNTWYHVAYSLTYPGNVIVYLNGIAVNTMTMPAAFPTKVLGRVNIGGVAGFRGFSGYIDDWRVYDRVLTSSEVVQVANIYPYCAPGTYVNASTGTCQNCTPGTYSSIQGSVTCLACPAITNSTTGSPVCHCNPSYTGPNFGPCIACGMGTYKDKANTAPCTACPLNSNSSAGSGNITDCICDAWCSGPNGGPCVPKNSTLNVSSGVYQCSPGFTGPDRTGPCVACSVGTYKNVPGSVACSFCAPGQYQDAVATTACSSCAPDTFQNASGSVACQACPAGFRALSATTALQDCCGPNSMPSIMPLSTIEDLYRRKRPWAHYTPGVETNVNDGVWNKRQFTDVSGNARHAVQSKGDWWWLRNRLSGTKYIEGDIGAGVRFPAGSIPEKFTICSSTRYAGESRNRILQMAENTKSNGCEWQGGCAWFHGHDGNPWQGFFWGATRYGNSWKTAGTYSTDRSWVDNNPYYLAGVWVVTCAKNDDDKIIRNAVENNILIRSGVYNAQNAGGLGNRTLVINYGNSDATDAYPGDFFNSPWHFAHLMIWDSWLTLSEMQTAQESIQSYMDTGKDFAQCGWSNGVCAAINTCLCNPGYTGPDTGASKGQCIICPSGTYKPTNGSAACTSCPVNSNSSVGSTILTNCFCNPGYTGPNGGPCLACDAGKFKNASGSQACDVCAANTYSASGVLVCTSCLAGFQSAPGSRVVADCCDPNTTFVTNLFYSLSSAAQAALTGSYVARVSSPPMFGYAVTSASVAPTYFAGDGFNGQPFLRFSKTSSTKGPHQYLEAGAGQISVSSGLTIVTVVQFTENMKGVLLSMQQQSEFVGFEVSRSNGLQFCVCALTGGNECSNVCTDAAVPMNVWLQVSYTYNPSITNKQLLKVSYTSGGSTVVLSKTSTVQILPLTQPRKAGFGYSSSTDCSGSFGSMVPRAENLPMCDRANFDLAGFYFMQTLVSDADVLVLFQAIATASQIAFDRSTSCPCNAGFGGSGRSNCASCAPGTYKSEIKSVSCSLCAANTYSTAVQALNVSTCLSCPNNSVSVAGRFECECNFGYEGGMYSCSACVPGKFKRVLGTSACVDCPANMEAPGFASVVCASLPGYNGLGYALDDVARSCGASLAGTCTTLSNGATSNAAGGADGGLDGSASTSVSVAFGQNLASSCGNTGTGACATTAGTVFRPWWGVDFAQRRSVFAVSVMSTSWANTNDFKVVVGDVADAQSPLNAVCADYLVGTGSAYVKFTCEDSVSGRYLYIVNGPHAANSLILSDVVVEAFNYAANASLMLPWWAVDFEVERAVSAIVIQAQTASVIQVRVGHSSDPLQNAVCKDNVTIVTTGNNNVNCSSAMLGRYLFVIGTGNKVLVLNDVRVLGFPAAQCAAGTYKPLVGNTNCTACPSFSTSVVGATSVGQCSCRAGYLDVWS